MVNATLSSHAPNEREHLSLAALASRNPEALAGLSDAELLQLEYNWKFWARPDQLEPDEFKSGLALIWLLLAGRGYGKTRTGAETVNTRVEENRSSRIGLIAPSAADARDVMVEGPSGIVTVSKPWFKANYMASKRRVNWPNGATATIYSAEDPDQLRGPQHDLIWCDELAAWPRLVQQETWDNAMFGLRQGAAQAIITTTPRPIKILKDLIKRVSTYVTKGSTYENLGNLSAAFREQIVETYEGTRLGRQELHAEILDDTPGALWTWAMLDSHRVREGQAPPFKRVAISVDPAGSRSGHEVGICAGGLSYAGEGFLLGDYSMNGSPDEWGQKVLWAYDFHQADAIVVETNFGGEMVANVLHNIRPEAPVHEVRASRGKHVRAEPVSMLNERGLIHHVGSFPILEDQLTTWISEDGPNDRLDAYVWLWTLLMSSQVRGRLWFPGSEVA